MTNIEVISGILHGSNYHIDVALNGFEALELVESNVYDVVLLDLMMPKMSGIELCKRLRETFTLYNLPILLVTALSSKDDILAGFNVGANDYVSKPFDRSELLARVSTLISLKKHVQESIESSKLILKEQLEKEHAEAHSKELMKHNLELNNTLEELRRTQLQLVQSEKMASLGDLVAGVAHEISTPVGVSILGISYYKEKTEEITAKFENNELKKSEIEKFLGLSNETCKSTSLSLNKAAEIITSFKNVSVGVTNEEIRTFNLREHIGDNVISLSPKFKATRISLEIDCDEKIEITSIPGLLSQILTNFINNSLIHAFDEDTEGIIRISTEVVGDTLILRYSDNGKGILPQNLDKIFDPFFTTARSKGGTGLGLHIIYNIVNQNLKGNIKCFSEIGKGTTFVIEIPKNLSI
jgi:signal transduction histidine kinase